MRPRAWRRKHRSPAAIGRNPEAVVKAFLEKRVRRAMADRPQALGLSRGGVTLAPIIRQNTMGNVSTINPKTTALRSSDRTGPDRAVPL